MEWFAALDYGFAHYTVCLLGCRDGDGNTFVVGGLISTNNTEQVTKFPILGDIPILGFLFRSTFTQKNFTELLFFITPRVIRDPASTGIIVPNPG